MHQSAAHRKPVYTSVALYQSATYSKKTSLHICYHVSATSRQKTSLHSCCRVSAIRRQKTSIYRQPVYTSVILYLSASQRREEQRFIHLTLLNQWAVKRQQINISFAVKPSSPHFQCWLWILTPSVPDKHCKVSSK